MNDPKKSVFDKFYECFNNSVEWGVSSTKNPCYPKKKFDRKGSTSSKDDLKEKINSEAEIQKKEGSASQGNSGDSQHSQRTIEDGKGSQSKSEESSDSQKKLENCPSLEEPPACVILMQDPTVPYYCNTEEKKSEPHSHKKGYFNEPREPNCCCDCCKRKNYEKRCTGKTETPFSEDIRLERA